MKEEFDQYFLEQTEPNKSCLLALREIILSMDANVSSRWKYSMPFFQFAGKMFCYLWVHKKLKMPYIGFVEGTRLDHPMLLAEKRTRMKIFLVDPKEDLPIRIIKSLLKQAIDLYRKGIIKIKN